MARRFQQRRLGKKQRRTFVSNVLEDPTQQKPSKKFFILSLFYTFIQYLISFFRPKLNNSETNSGLTNRIEQLETTVAKLSKKIVKLEKKFSSSTPPPSQTQATTITLAPPPPPPPILTIPPPPPPPPPANIPAPPKFKKTTQAPQKQKSSFLPAPIGISVDAIKNLKLKKVSDRQNEGSKPGAKSNKVQLVTMQDLQNVKLKRRTQQTDENKNILPLSKLKLTKSLKKTNIIRSPGGTPLVKRDENQSTGTGLTPAFTRALKKKFECSNSMGMSAHPATPGLAPMIDTDTQLTTIYKQAVHKTSPISIEESPKSWRC